MRQVKSISILLALLFAITSCKNTMHRDSIVIKNADSNELTFILEMNTKNNLKAETEDFTQYLSDFIVERESSTIYGYYLSGTEGDIEKGETLGITYSSLIPVLTKAIQEQQQQLEAQQKQIQSLIKRLEAIENK